MPILLERERQTKDQLKAVFAYIRKKRDKEQQALAEIRAKEEEEKRRKREEEKKKETVEDVKREIDKYEAKLEELKQEKHSLFQQFKRVLYEEDTKKRREREAAALAAQHQVPQPHDPRPLGPNPSLQPFPEFDKNTAGRNPTMIPMGGGRGTNLLHAQQMPLAQALSQQQPRAQPHSAPMYRQTQSVPDQLQPAEPQAGRAQPHSAPMYRQTQAVPDQLQPAEPQAGMHHSQPFPEGLHKSSTFGHHSSTLDLDSQHKRQETNVPQHRPLQQPPQQQQAQQHQQQQQQQQQMMYNQHGQAQPQGYSVDHLKYVQQAEPGYPVPQDSQQAGQAFQPHGAPQIPQQAHKHFQQHHQQPFHMAPQEQIYQQLPYPAQQQQQQPVHLQQNPGGHVPGPFPAQHGYTAVLDGMMSHPQQAQHYPPGQQPAGLPMVQQHEQAGHPGVKMGLLPTPGRSADARQPYSGLEDRPPQSERAKDKRGPASDYPQSKRSTTHKYNPYPTTKGHHQGGTPKKYTQGRHSGSQEGPSDRHKMKHAQEGPSSERYTAKHAPEGSSADKYTGKRSASEGSAEAAAEHGSYSRHHNYHQSKGHKGSGSHSMSQPRQRYYQ